MALAASRPRPYAGPPDERGNRRRGAPAVWSLSSSSEQNQLFTRVGLLLLGGVSLALVPLVATAMVGVVAIFGRRYRAGEWITIGALVGEVTHVGYLGVTLVPPEAGRLWVPHLSMLWKPVRHPDGRAAPPSSRFPSIFAPTHRRCSKSLRLLEARERPPGSSTPGS